MFATVFVCARVCVEPFLRSSHERLRKKTFKKRVRYLGKIRYDALFTVMFYSF